VPEDEWKDAALMAGHKPPPAVGDYFPNLTGLRGIAAGWVVLFHLWLAAGSPRLAWGPLDLTAVFSSGYLGVDLFFVLSGFLLGLPFMRWALGEAPFPRLGRFWKRRALRVLPAFYAQLGVLVLLALVGIGTLPPWQELLAYVSMEFVYFGFPLWNGVWWTLPVEWNFYLVLPLLGFILGRARWGLVMALLVVASVTIRIACWHLLYDGVWEWFLAYPLILQTPARIDEFAFGVVAAGLHLRRAGGGTSTRDLMLLLAGLACVFLLMGYLDGRGDIFVRADAPLIFVYATLAGAALALVVLAAASPLPLARWLFGGRALAFVGTVSYSLYLWHNPLIGWLYPLWPGLPHGAGGLGLRALVVVPASLVAAWVSYRLVERPFLVTKPAAALARREATAG
jgi:peptidoglycan/LPS O-acetylase OafA/YrhL